MLCFKMISFSKRANILLLTVFTLSGIGCTVDSNAKKKEDKDSADRLKVVKSFKLPLIELSGLAWRTHPETKKKELLLVSDREYKVFSFEWPDNPVEIKNFKIQSHAIPVKNFKKQSQWEGIASDPSGRIYVLQENPTKILVISPDFKKLEKEISITKDIMKDNNSSGEGLVIDGDDLFILKEKNPIKIVKVNLKDDKVSLIKEWDLVKKQDKKIDDASDLTRLDNGDFYISSDQKELIAKIVNIDKNYDKEFDLHKKWKLPKGIKQAEGLVIDDQMRPIIAIDQLGDSEPNLFLLSPLE